MNNLMSMNEYINNINNFQYILKKFKNELDNTIGREIQFTGHYDSSDDKPYSYLLTIVGDIINKETPKLEKCLEKYKKIFDKEELFFDYKSGRFAESKLGILTHYYECIIKNNKILRAKPSKILYHTSDIKNRDSIKNNGLIPISNKKWVQMLWYKPAIFASKNFENLFKYNGKDIWVIDTTNLKNTWWVDLNVNKYTSGHEDFIMTYEPIPPEYLELYEK